MEIFVGLDVSLKETSVRVFNQAGTVIFEGKVVSEPKAITRLIRKHATNVPRVGLESGPTSVWLSHALLAEGLPLACLATPRLRQRGQTFAPAWFRYSATHHQPLTKHGVPSAHRPQMNVLLRP
jgi:hypothetical protein